MSFRHYFKVVNKDVVAKLQACEDLYQLIEYLNVIGIKVDDDFIPIMGIGECIYNFGSGYDHAHTLKQLATPLFQNESIVKRFGDYDLYIGGKELIQSAIEWQTKKIATFYTELLDFDIQTIDEDPTRKAKLFQDMYHHLKSHKGQWVPTFTDCDVINLCAHDKTICNSDLYEHSIFELAHQYKQFNEDEMMILFLGW